VNRGAGGRRPASTPDRPLLDRAPGGGQAHADDLTVELVPGCGHFIADDLPTWLP
jgi:hypothetical protein